MSPESFIAGFIACYAIALQLYLFYVHSRLAEFIDYANKNKNILRLGFHVPDFYFPLYLSRCHYGFAIHMYKMKKLPEDASRLFSNYDTLRKLACFALFFHIFLGVLIVSLAIFHRT